jgi:flagellar protein FlgJ
MIDPAHLGGKLALDASHLDNLKRAAHDNSPAALKATASQFEALFVNMMLKSMRAATPQDGPFDNEQSRTFTAMLDQQLSQSIAARGIGLADVLARQLSRTGGLDPASLPTTLMAPTAMPQDGQRQPSAHKPAPTSPLGIAAAAVERAAGKIARGVSDTVETFRRTMAGHAESASRASGIPASFMIGQAALESGWGRRQITGSDGTPSYNLFGIKATGGWTGKVVEAVTTEYIDGRPQKRVEKFRAYDSYAESFQDFARLIANSPRYEKVMANLDNAQRYAGAIQKAGYATDPAYADKLVSVIRRLAAG